MTDDVPWDSKCLVPWAVCRTSPLAGHHLDIPVVHLELAQPTHINHGEAVMEKIIVITMDG